MLDHLLGIPRLQQLRGWPNGDQADCGGGRHGKEHGGTDGQSVWLGQDGQRGGVADGIDGIDTLW